MGASYQILLTRLDEFIRKYYKNLLIRGLLYAFTLALSFYITLVVAAYYGNFGIPLRAALFYLFAGGNLFILIRYIAMPLLKLYHIGEVLSYEAAAAIIGRHFGEVQDKLLNILQLKKQNNGTMSLALLEAGIEQKIKDIRPVPFTIAIDLSGNKRYLRFLFIPLLIMLLIWWLKPVIIGQGTRQIIHYNTHYAKLAPFQFTIANKNLNAIEQKDFTLSLKLTGSEAPEDVYIEYEGSRFKMEKQNTVNFQYVFRNVQHGVAFDFSAAGYESDQYKLTVIPNPVLMNFEVMLHYPAYIGRKDEILQNTGDMSIPQGSTVKWNFNTRNTNTIRLYFNDTVNNLQPSGSNQYSFTRRFMQSKNYSISTSNQFLTNQDSVKYAIQVIPDLFPAIEVEQKQDSISAKQFYFNGQVKDDYGFTRMAFIYRVYKSDDTTSKAGKTYRTEVNIAKNVTRQPFYYYWNMDTLNLTPGEQVEYYFEVWDNDEVNGNKSTKSTVMHYKAPTLEQIEKTTDANNSEIKNDINKTMQQANILQTQMEQMRADMYNKQELNWADKKKIKDMLDQQMELQKKAEQISKENKKSNRQQLEFQKKDSDLVQQQEQLQKLFDQLASDSLKNKIAELQKMLDQMNKDQIQQELQKMTTNNQDMKKELQRTLELFKQMEFQQQLSQNIEHLDSLAKKQQELSKDTKDKKISNDELQKRQDALNKEMKDVAQNLDELQKKNEQLEEPTEFKSPKQAAQDVQQQQQNSSKQLSQNKNSKAAQSQQNASQGMQKMADEMANFQSQEQSQQDEANENTLRNILNSLVQLSFGQEALMGQTSVGNTMQYADIARKQKELYDNAHTIGDSLYMLSKKAPQLAGIVNQELSKILVNMTKAVNEMEARQGFEAASRQQYAMTSVNNLALMLSEALASMQQQSQMKTPGSGSCKKPGGKGNHPSMSQLKQMQQQMGKQLDQMMQAMQKGKQPGNKQGKSNEGMSEQLAKMAAQQEYIRQQMQQAEDQNQNQKGAGELGNMAQEMQKIENDIVNQQITAATLQRQEALLKHLLEYEKSEKTQGQDPDFESHIAKKQFFGNPNPFFQYNTQRNQQDELLKTVPPDLKSFYKNKVNDYFNSFQE